VAGSCSVSALFSERINQGIKHPQQFHQPVFELGSGFLGKVLEIARDEDLRLDLGERSFRLAQEVAKIPLRIS
jgi:hypothetical protein